MDFKNLSDCELAEIMVNYINRVAHLQYMIANYLDGTGNGAITAEHIKNVYRQLKSEIREDAHYLSLQRNSKGSNMYMYYFKPSILGADAYGFTVSVNAPVDGRMFSCVEEAHYRMRKYHSLEVWGSMM